MLITGNHRHVKNSVFQPTPHTTKSSDCEIPPVKHLQQIRYTFCGVLWSKRDVGIKVLEDTVLLLASAICTRSSPAAWHGRNSSAEYERQHRSELLSSVMLPIPKGKKFAWGFFCFFKNPYLQTSNLHTRITPRIILKVL